MCCQLRPIIARVSLQYAYSQHQNLSLVCSAGALVTYTVTLQNIGAVRLHSTNITWPDWVTPTTCTPAMAGSPSATAWTVDPFRTVVCQGTYTFNQDSYEEGTRGMVAQGSSVDYSGLVPSSEAQVAPTYTPSAEFAISGCFIPTRRKCSAWRCCCCCSCSLPWHGMHCMLALLDCLQRTAPPCSPLRQTLETLQHLIL